MIRKMAGSNEFRIFIALLCFFSFLLPFTIFVFFFSAICVNQTTHPLISHALSLFLTHLGQPTPIRPTIEFSVPPRGMATGTVRLAWWRLDLSGEGVCPLFVVVSLR